MSFSWLGLDGRSPVQRAFHRGVRAVLRELAARKPRLMREQFNRVVRDRAEAQIQAGAQVVTCDVERGFFCHYAVGLGVGEPSRLLFELIDTAGVRVPGFVDVEETFAVQGRLHACNFDEVADALHRFVRETLDVSDVFARGVNRPDWNAQLDAACAVNRFDAARILHIRQTGTVNSVPDDANFRKLFTFTGDALRQYVEERPALPQQLLERAERNAPITGIFFVREWNGFHVGATRAGTPYDVTVHHTIVDAAVDYVLLAWNMRELA